MQTWFYILSENEPTHKLYTVGFEDLKGNWHSDSDHNDKEEAVKRCSILNGQETAAERDRLKEDVHEWMKIYTAIADERLKLQSINKELVEALETIYKIEFVNCSHPLSVDREHLKLIIKSALQKAKEI